MLKEDANTYTTHMKIINSKYHNENWLEDIIRSWKVNCSLENILSLFDRSRFRFGQIVNIIDYNRRSVHLLTLVGKHFKLGWSNAVIIYSVALIVFPLKLTESANTVQKKEINCRDDFSSKVCFVNRVSTLRIFCFINRVSTLRIFLAVTSIVLDWPYFPVHNPM